MTQKADTRFKAGQSGNPEGRKPGCGKVAALRKEINEAVPGIVAALVIKAKEGDVGAARLLLERAIPPMRAAEQSAPMDLPDGTLTEQGRAILTAAATGTLTPGQASQMLQGLGALAKLVEIDELAKRIAALEAKNARD